MLPETHPLIDSITQPLADDLEMRLATHALLEQEFDPEHPDVGETLLHLQKSQNNKVSNLFMILPWAIAVIAIGVSVLLYLPEIRLAKSISKFSLFEPWEKPALPKNLTKQERVILGDPKLDPIEQKRQLHLSDPESPAYYAEYVQAWVGEHDGLPNGYFETVGEIAPNNSFFLFFAASVIGEEAIEKKKSARASGEPRMIDGVRLRHHGNAQEFIIKDQANYDKALTLIAKASKLPEFETYTNEMTVERVRVLPRRTMSEFMVSWIHVASTPSHYIQLIKCSELMSARAEELSKNGNQEDFIMLANHYNALVRGLAHNPDVSIVNEMVYRIVALNGTTNFHAAAERLNLTELKESYRIQRDALREEDDKRTLRNKKSDDGSRSVNAYSGFHYTSINLLGRHVSSPPPISDADLKPMRIAEHEFVGGVGILGVALLILPAALMVFLFRLIPPRSIQLTAKGMTKLLRLSDWAWTLGLGVALPIAIFLIVSRLSPSGGREWGVTFVLFIFPSVHLAALYLSLLIVPAYVLRRRLVSRLAPFRLPDRFGRFPCFVIGGLLLWSLLAFPIIKHFRIPDYIIYAGPPAICLCFLFANALRVIFDKSSIRFTQVATALAVLPVYPIAIVALCLLLPTYHLGEKKWLARETLLFIDPAAPDLGAYEYKVAAQKRKEINAIMGIE